MKPIDADALINEIKKETEKAIEQDDKVGSFWLGYIAGLVIKQPTIQSALDSETIIRTIETGITATNSNDAYSLGMRNGTRWCKSLIDGAEPKFEDDVMSVDDGKELPIIQPEKAQLSSEGATSDLISRQQALDIFDDYNVSVENGELEAYSRDRKRLCDLPPIQPATPCYLGSPCEHQNPDVVISQPEPAIPVAWIDKYIEWLKSFDNEFANLAAAHISVMLKKWRDEPNE